MLFYAYIWFEYTCMGKCTSCYSFLLINNTYSLIHNFQPLLRHLCVFYFFPGIEIAYNSASGEVLISENPSGSSNMNELPCVKLDVRLSTSLPWEEQLLPCLKKDVKVTIPKDLPLSSIRVKSCIPDSDKCSTVGPLVCE